MSSLIILLHNSQESRMTLCLTVCTFGNPRRCQLCCTELAAAFWVAARGLLQGVRASERSSAQATHSIPKHRLWTVQFGSKRSKKVNTSTQKAALPVKSFVLLKNRTQYFNPTDHRCLTTQVWTPESPNLKGQTPGICSCLVVRSIYMVQVSPNELNQNRHWCCL